MNARNVRCIPLYCLYTHWPANAQVSPRWTCGSFAAAIESYGCSLVDAFVVRNSKTNTSARNIGFLLKHMMPWHCLVCCHGYGGKNLPSRALGVWRNILRKQEMSDNEFNIINDPPDYVRRLQRNELYESPDERLRIITIFREREGR